ncbi:MAG: hypothetical protein MJZ86_00815 [Bacteroidales bacterium]|nr:hypothetical protein [Bacteroidales bacterium]
MKKIMLVLAAAMLVLCASCVKEKNCRCAVMGTQTVRIITIKSGDCRKMNYITYFNDLDSSFVDHVVCTDYPFDADSAIVNL